MELRHKTTSAFLAGASSVLFFEAYRSASDFARESAAYSGLQDAQAMVQLASQLSQVATGTPGLFSNLLSSVPFKEIVTYLSGNISGQMQSLQASMASSADATNLFTLLGTTAAVVAVVVNYDGIKEGVDRFGTRAKNAFSSLSRHASAGLHEGLSTLKRVF